MHHLALVAMAESEDSIRYSEEVEAAISAMFPSEDPLDKPDFDIVKYINDLFPNEQVGAWEGEGRRDYGVCVCVWV